MTLSADRLAIDGGSPIRTAPFAQWPVVAEDEIQAVTQVLRSGRVNYWTGNQGVVFEESFARFTGRRHALALANGTLALELALYALDIGPGDEVIVPSRTFIASASCVVARGAKPVMADVDPDSGNITAASIAAVHTPRTRAVIVVHLGGWPCDMDSIMALASQHGIFVIEDCAQALGGSYHGRPIGALGHLAAFSFCQDKILTTGGEGGMLVCDDDTWRDRAWSYRDHGKDRTKTLSPNPDKSFRWVHDRFGSNWRMTEMQSAIGRIALEKVPGWIERRAANTATLTSALAGIDALRIPKPPNGLYHAGYRLYAYIRPERLRKGWTRDGILRALSAEGIPCFTGSCSEIYLEEAFASAGLQPGSRLPVARLLGDASLAFLVHPTLTSADMKDMAAAVQKVMGAASA